MKASTLLTLPFAALALAKAIPDRASFYERAASPQVPESTPTGSLCALVERDVAVASATIPSASEIASAVAGCIGVSLIGVTTNDIVNGVCKPFTLIFARGTTETGNIGELVGPPFVLALKEAFGANNVAVQGVNNYPAVIPDYCTGGSISGSQDMAQVCQVAHIVLMFRPTDMFDPARPTNNGAVPHNQTVHQWLQSGCSTRPQRRRHPEIELQRNEFHQLSRDIWRP